MDSHSFSRYYKRDLTKIILVLKAPLIPLKLSEEVIAHYNPNLKIKNLPAAKQKVTGSFPAGEAP